MRLRPRHYVLFALIVAVFVYNIIRNHRSKPSLTPTPIHVVPTGPKADTPVWRAFDHATALRDAPNAEFQPALDALHLQIDQSPVDPNLSAVQGCLTWLEFSRQGVTHPSRDTEWKDRSTHHLNGCTQYHLDTSTP
jgi:hypothetical protein